MHTLKYFKVVKDGRLNCQHFKILMEAYERARLEKNKNTTQTAVRIVWKKMKANFLTANELGKELRRQANEGKIYRLQKGLK